MRLGILAWIAIIGVGVLSQTLIAWLNKKYAGTRTLRWISRAVLLNVMIFVVLVTVNESLPGAHFKTIGAGPFTAYDAVLGVYLATIFFSVVYLLGHIGNHWLKSTFQHEIQKYMWIVFFGATMYLGQDYPKLERVMYLLGFCVFFAYYFLVMEMGWMLKKKPGPSTIASPSA